MIIVHNAADRIPTFAVICISPAESAIMTEGPLKGDIWQNGFLWLETLTDFSMIHKMDFFETLSDFFGMP